MLACSAQVCSQGPKPERSLESASTRPAAQALAAFGDPLAAGFIKTDAGGYRDIQTLD
jgi:hypothetical protein